MRSVSGIPPFLVPKCQDAGMGIPRLWHIILLPSFGIYNAFRTPYIFLLDTIFSYLKALSVISEIIHFIFSLRFLYDYCFPFFSPFQSKSIAGTSIVYVSVMSFRIIEPYCSSVFAVGLWVNLSFGTEWDNK